MTSRTSLPGGQPFSISGSNLSLGEYRATIPLFGRRIEAAVFDAALEHIAGFVEAKLTFGAQQEGLGLTLIIMSGD